MKTSTKTLDPNPIMSEQTRMTLHSNIEVINVLSNLLHQDYYNNSEIKNRLGLNPTEEQTIKTQLLKYVNNL